MWDAIWTDARLATMAGGAPYGAIDDGAIAVAGGRIAWVGPRQALPGLPASLARNVHSAGWRWITPGLVDCHTHIVFVGDRAMDFEMRLAGADRATIEAAGGGIPSTMRRVRAASETALYTAAASRLDYLLAEGVTTIEIKSGYGLDVDTELRQLRVARELGRRHPVTVRTTFLGAHGVAPEYQGRKDEYIDFVCKTSLPAAARAGLADAVDGTLENSFFSPAQMGRLFEAARALGLPVKAHTDQYGDAGGAATLARYKGLSADHLEYAARDGIAAMGQAGTVAVLLPGANYILLETKRPPVGWLREAGVRMALATNCNPGSSPCTSLLLIMNMGCILFGLTAEEALAAVTRNGAAALGLAATHGTLEAGKVADFVIWDVERPAELAYRLGFNPCRQVVKDGKTVRDRAASGR
jgi:imidazolonepropionase